MDQPIKNLTDLRNEIYRLKALEQQQSTALGQRFKSPSAVFSTIISLFRFTPGANGAKPGYFDQDIVTVLSRFLLPFTLNKTIFRNSGFVIKALVGFISQKASRFITEDAVVSLWEKAGALFKSKNGEEVPDHKGVPPLSETY